MQYHTCKLLISLFNSKSVTGRKLPTIEHIVLTEVQI